MFLATPSAKRPAVQIETSRSVGACGIMREVREELPIDPFFVQK